MERALIERGRKGGDDDRAGPFVDIQPIHQEKFNPRRTRENKAERTNGAERAREKESVCARRKRTREENSARAEEASFRGAAITT